MKLKFFSMTQKKSINPDKNVLSSIEHHENVAYPITAVNFLSIYEAELIIPMKANRETLIKLVESLQDTCETDHGVIKDFQLDISDDGVHVVGDIQACLIVLRHQSHLSFETSIHLSTQLQETIVKYDVTSEDKTYLETFEKNSETLAAILNVSANPQYRTAYWVSRSSEA